MGDSTSMADSIKKGWEVTGNTDVWELLCKAVNHDTGEYHCTKVLHLADGGCLVQSDTRTTGGQFIRVQTHCTAPPVIVVSDG